MTEQTNVKIKKWGTKSAYVWTFFLLETVGSTGWSGSSQRDV